MDAAPAPSPAAFPAGQAGVVELDDLDAIDEVSPVWDHEHVQVGRGRARVSVSLAHSACMQVAEVHRSPGVRIRDSGPPGSFVLATLLESDRQDLQGLRWEPGALGVLRPGAEFELMAAAPHRIIVLSVLSERLDEECLARWGHPFPRDGASPFLRWRDASSRSALVETCRRWLAAACAAPGLLAGPGGGAPMEEEILGALLGGVERRAHLPRRTIRRDVVRRAEAFLRASLRDRITMGDVCAEVRMSPRGLHAAFEAVHGIPPKAYWRVLRLNAVRRELLSARPGTRVGEIATRWGFFELGYFSVDYRKMFGESPRETLRAAGIGRRPAPALRETGAP